MKKILICGLASNLLLATILVAYRYLLPINAAIDWAVIVLSSVVILPFYRPESIAETVAVLVYNLWSNFWLGFVIVGAVFGLYL